MPNHGVFLGNEEVKPNRKIFRHFSDFSRPAACSRSPRPTEVKPHEMVQAFIPLHFFDRAGGWRRLSFQQIPAHRPLRAEPGPDRRGDPARGFRVQPGRRLHLPAGAVRYARGKDARAVRVYHIGEHDRLRFADLRPARPAGQLRRDLRLQGKFAHARDLLFGFERRRSGLYSGRGRGRLCGGARVF